MTVLKYGCPQCDLIALGRRAGLEQALATVDQGGRAATQLRALLEVNGGIPA
jgi:hypothetical protein